jgi:hypothetical protein
VNLSAALIWGFASTVILTIVIGGGRGLKLTRMDIPFILGTIFTPDRDKAKFIGGLVHIVNGWLFSFIYVAAFVSSGLATWWFGAAIGLVHSLFVLIVGMRLLPGVHPRMASETSGPDPTHQLEPPGFLVLNYGVGTPVTTIIAHILYGATLGLFYKL